MSLAFQAVMAILSCLANLPHIIKILLVLANLPTTAAFQDPNVFPDIGVGSDAIEEQSEGGLREEGCGSGIRDRRTAAYGRHSHIRRHLFLASHHDD